MSLCAFPVHKVDKYSEILISEGYKIAVAEADGEIWNVDTEFKCEKSQKQTHGQLSLFGEEVGTEKPVKSAFTAIDEQIITAELLQGSNFEDGKFRIENFAKTSPKITEFAKFLREEYGTGGSSGTHESVKFSDHDSKGIRLRLHDERQVDLTWNAVAKRVSELIGRGEYITEADIAQRIKSAQYYYDNYKDEPEDSIDRIYVERAKKTLAEYGLLENKTAETPSDSAFSDINTADEIQEISEYNFKVGDIIELDEGIFEVTQLENSLVELQDTTTDELSVIHSDELYNSGFTVIEEADEEYIIDSGEATVDSDEEPDITDLAVAEDDIIITPIYPKVKSENEISETPKCENFRITDENLGVGGAKEKFKNNIAAIELLKEIEHDFNRVATLEEQEILSRYVGWGGLSQAFDENNSQWENEYKLLKETLSSYEYESARASTLNAHYTSPTVIKAIYEGLENLGFTTGNVLEPATGVGNFFGMLPESMQGSKLYGVELDDVSGRIAKQLYPNADISIRGFEEKQFSDNFFDVAVGNIPFGGYSVPDKRYDKLNLQIHDYFFAKALDKVRPGGIVAFVTSKGKLDKQNLKFRKYLAERADLLGAIRLPNTAFKANVGTEVTSDIIFLQKRDRVMEIEPEWVKLGEYISPENSAKISNIEAEIDSYQEANLSYSITWETRQKNIKAIKELKAELDTLKEESALPCNRYFIGNPDMILDTMTRDNMMYGNENETTCKPFYSADLSEQLKSAIANIKGKIPEYEHGEDDKIIDSIPADESVRNFSFTLVNDNLYYRENSRMNRIEFPKKTEERIKAMVGLQDCVRELINLQLNEYSESDIVSQQVKLNMLYDSFSKKHGLINSSANRNAFKDYSGYYLLCSLEILNEQGELERKADMFTKRTIKQRKCETLHVPFHIKSIFNVMFSKYTSEWNIDGKNADHNNMLAITKFGTSQKNAYAIIEDTLNLRDTRVYDRITENGQEKSVLNKKETIYSHTLSAREKLMK